MILTRQIVNAFDNLSNEATLRIVSPKGGWVVKRRGVTLYSLAEVAAASGVSRQTIYNWLASSPPLIKYSYEVGGAPVFTRAELEAAKHIAAERRAAVKSLRLSRVTGGR